MLQTILFAATGLRSCGGICMVLDVGVHYASIRDHRYHAQEYLMKSTACPKISTFSCKWSFRAIPTKHYELYLCVTYTGRQASHLAIY